MKCVICDQRKPKRFCPAKNGLICPQCCGEKRVLEIDCPETCEYLKLGRERELTQYSKILNSFDEAAVAKSQRTIHEHRDALVRLEYALGLERLSSPDLSDQDLVQALDLLLDTYGTESKGVLYEKTSDDLRIEPLRKQVRGVVESLRNPEGDKGTGIVDPQNVRLTLSGAIDCLEFVRSMAKGYIEKAGSDIGYLDFLARLVPREQKRGSILIP